MLCRLGLAVAVGLTLLGLGRADEGVRTDGTRVRGTLTFADGRFAFDGGPVGGLDLVRFDSKPVAEPDVPLWHQLRLGPGEVLTAEVRHLDRTHLFVRPAWGEVYALRRSAVDRVGNVPGWRPVWFDSFELGLDAWAVTGRPRTSTSHLELFRAGQAIERSWKGPLAAGRVCVGVAKDMGRRPVTLELPFVRGGKPAPVRVEVAGPGEWFTVTSPARPSHEGKVRRGPGPTRVSVEFDRDRLHVSVGDRVVWAQDEGPGELSAVRLAAGDGAEFVEIDDVLVATPEPAREPRPWADLTADAVRSPGGDETFGTLTLARQWGVTLDVHGKQSVALRWPDVSEFAFRRVAVIEQATRGEHVQVRVRSVEGARDVLEGAAATLDDRRLVLAHPVFGDLTIPRARLEEIRFRFRGRRVPVDTTPRHLGARPAFGFAVPKPEGLRVARTVTLDPLPAGGFVVIDAARVSGTGTPVEVLVNGERVGELNRLADRADPAVRRYRLPVPAAAWRKETEVEVRLRAGGGRVDGVDLRAVRLEVSP